MHVKNESSPPALTELEGGALGVIEGRGAATAYQVKEWFARSPSSYWSGSAGAVYPLMQRLEDKGLLASRNVSETRRPRREYTLIPAGQAAFRAWMLDTDQASDAGYDPLRTRMTMLVLVDRASARKLLDEVEERTQVMTSPSPDPHVMQIHESWRSMRLTWIAELKRQFG